MTSDRIHRERILALRTRIDMKPDPRDVLVSEGWMEHEIDEVMSEQVPTFLCYPISGGGLQFRCPTCRKVNHHGEGEGHRVSHCACWPNGHYLLEYGE